MKKHIQNIWVRLLACVMCAVSVVGIIVNVAGMVFFSQYPNKQDTWESQLDTILEDYALYAVDNINEEHLNKVKLDSFFDNTNVYIEVDKYFYGEEQEEPEITSIYSNMPVDHRPICQLEIYEGSIPSYSVDSIETALKSDYDPAGFLYTVSTPITGYAFDVNEGLFYYSTPDGYFEVDYIEVAEGNGDIYDYALTYGNTGVVYFNSYYLRILDTTNYENWGWVTINGKHLGITKKVSGNVVQLIEDSDVIALSRRTENFYVKGDRIDYISDPVEKYVVNVGMNDEWIHHDMLMDWWNLVNGIYGYQSKVVYLLWLFVLLLVLSLVLLGCSVSGEKEKLKLYHRIPVGIATLLLAAVECVFVWGMALWINYFALNADWELSLEAFTGTVLIILFVMMFLFFTYVANVIARIKARVFFRYSELYYISRPLVYLVRTAKEQMSLFWKIILGMLAVSVAEFLIIVSCQYEIDNLLVIWFVSKLVEFPLLIYVLTQMKQLQQGSQRIASGDLSKPIDTSKMLWEFKKHGENINKVGEGISLAVEEQMKSERFKTELITNVSHDIKTPLTSIINYVDLMKKEEITDSTMLEYVDVLDRQSARLKKLIEDLMEASKASTGNLDVTLEECDMNVLLSQAVGEFEEKLTANGLEVIVNTPEEPVHVMVDGRHMWRVFDNLLNNICKYSQPNTRVYISLEEQENIAYITFKNISKTALNIPSEQLMQRFVRGDSSRHTEGSGLGLSIAQSLTELMRGTMKLDIDGDLFKVILKFNTI